MIQRLLWVLAALGCGALSFVIGVYATFPGGAARTRLEHEFHAATGKEMALSVEEIGPWRLSGIDMGGVQVYTTKRGKRSKEEPKPAMERTPLIHLDRLAVRLALFPVLLGKRAVSYAAEAYGGEVDGTWAMSETSVELAFDAADIDLSLMPIENETMSLALVGKIEGTCDLDIDIEDLKQSKGSLRLSFPGIGLGAGSKMAGFQLPEVVFEKAVVAAEVKEGKLEVTEGTFESPVLSATLSGDVSLNKKLGRSRNRLELSFSLPEDIDQLAQFSSELKRARDSEGLYHFLISGTVLKPTFRASRAGARKGDRPDADDPPPMGSAIGENLERPAASSLSDEDRKKRREQRIQERRERLRKRREEASAREPTIADPEDAPGLDGGEEFDPPGPDDFPELEEGLQDIGELPPNVLDDPMEDMPEEPPIE